MPLRGRIASLWMINYQDLMNSMWLFINKKWYLCGPEIFTSANSWLQNGSIPPEIISSFIFILPFLSYLSRIFYFSNFIMFLFLPVPLLQLGFPRPCPMLRRVHVVMVKAATRVLSTIPSPIYACTSSK